MLVGFDKEGKIHFNMDTNFSDIEQIPSTDEEKKINKGKLPFFTSNPDMLVSKLKLFHSDWHIFVFHFKTCRLYILGTVIL